MMPSTETLLRVSLWRGGADGRYESYTVPRRESQTVLDVVMFVQRHLDPTLSYRFACRVGVCGRQNAIGRYGPILLAGIEVGQGRCRDPGGISGGVQGAPVRNRRLAKDFEPTIDSARAFLYAASIMLLVRRIARAS
jgi:hypothetical protein